jgi:pilus biogenesis lipoprotein CpaD
MPASISNKAGDPSMSAKLRPLLIPLLAATFLAGCETERQPETADVASQGIPPTIKVSTSEQRHLVYVGTAAKPLSDPERASLVAFIGDTALGTPDAIHVRVRGTAGREQLAAVTRAIASAGVQPTKIEIESVPASDIGAGPGHPPGQSVEVVASISKVDFPSCPRQSWQQIGGVDNPTSSNFGCSFITQIEAQVADPRDLVQGESGGNTDATLTNAAIDRLHSDKVKRPETATISQVGAGGGGGQ